MPERIVNVGDLPSEEQDKLRTEANWKVDGEKGDWKKISDPHYGKVLHVAVVGEDDRVRFDKLNIQWVPGVYVVLVRVNPQGRAEFLMPQEKRILLRDETGEQGNKFIDNIPQGVIEEWKNETAEDAARREVRQEAGYHIDSLALIGRIALSPANSETIQPFYLGCIPYTQRAGEQQLDPGENINAGRWFTWQQIQELPLIDGHTIIGLALAQKVLRTALLK